MISVPISRNLSAITKTNRTCLIKHPVDAAAAALYPDRVAVELLVAERGSADVLVVEAPALGLTHMPRLRQICLALFGRFRNDCKTTKLRKIACSYVLPRARPTQPTITVSVS